MNKKVIVFGSIELARDVIEHILLPHPTIEIIGVVTEKNLSNFRSAEKSVYELCKTQKLPVINLKEVKNLKPDLGFSIRFNKIIDIDTLKAFKIGVFNTHGGVLPEYAGVYSNIHALINNENKYGVTLHKMDEGIDSGDIIDIKKTNITENDTGISLYRKGETLCYLVIKENLEKLISSNFKSYKQNLLPNYNRRHVYTKKQTFKLKYIPLDELNKEKSLRVIRAFDSSFHEPAYTLINHKKIYLRASY